MAYPKNGIYLAHNTVDGNPSHFIEVRKVDYVNQTFEYRCLDINTKKPQMKRFVQHKLWVFLGWVEAEKLQYVSYTESEIDAILKNLEWC